MGADWVVALAVGITAGPDGEPRRISAPDRRTALDALAGVVDLDFRHVLALAIPCWIVREHLTHRIACLLATARPHGT